MYHNYIRVFIINNKLVIKSRYSVDTFADSYTKALTVDNFCWH